jgi:hypothetical protein
MPAIGAMLAREIRIEGASMTRLIAAALFAVAAIAPAIACEFNKSAGTESQSTVASQAQQSKPVHQHNRS